MGMIEKEIAAKTGLRQQAVDNFINDNQIDSLKLLTALGKKTLKPMDLMTAISGNPNNKFFKAIVSQFSTAKMESTKIKEIIQPIVMEILAERKRPIKEATQGLNQSQPWSNLFIKGWGKDRNGNKTISVGFPNDRGWLIQTNGNLPKTHSILSSNPAKLSSNDLEDIGEEITDYVSQYGSKEQKSRLKRY